MCLGSVQSSPVTSETLTSVLLKCVSLAFCGSRGHSLRPCPHAMVRRGQGWPPSHGRAALSRPDLDPTSVLSFPPV